MLLPIDLSKKSPTTFEQDATLVAVVELSLKSWLVAGIVPGIDRHPLKKFEASENRLLALLGHWQQQALNAGSKIKRIVVAFEAGRDGFWLARWLRARGIEAYVIHPTSVAVSREHRRAKTDRLDTELLKRAFLGWLRGETHHCRMVAIPTIEEEDAKRPNREHDTLVRQRTRIINRIKSGLVRFGIQNFKPTLRKSAERLAKLMTPEGMRLPPNTVAELHRDMERLRFIRDQIKAVEQARIKNMKNGSEDTIKRNGALDCSRVRDRHRDRRHACARDFVAQPSGSKSRCTLCRPYRLARRERRPPAREGTRTSWECTGPSWHDPIGMARSQLP
jgi:transposase